MAAHIVAAGPEAVRKAVETGIMPDPESPR